MVYCGSRYRCGHRDAAAAKLCLGRAAQGTMHAALELHGADGLVSGQSLERAYRDTAALTMLAGSDDLLRSVIAGSLLSAG
jgi:alkylation response protein AidB-like acyl-CoA dehydrogenase